MSMRELGEYSQAVPLFDQALSIQRQIAAADPKDTRSLFDVYVDLTQAAYGYEESADPPFSTNSGARQRSLASAAPLLKQAELIALQLLKQNPSNDDWKASLADVQVRLGTLDQDLNTSHDSAALSATGLAALKELANHHPDSVLIRDMEVAALINVKPLTLRDPTLAIASAEQEALLTRRKQPGVLLSMAQAYRSAGQIEKARAAANEGLALLPPVTAGAPTPRTRKLLELQTETNRVSR
jgi:tetratricopeptide (TPR) repeat protein